MVFGATFIDTWGWIALGRRKDPRHDEAAEYYRALSRTDERIYTSDYVLDEAITLIFRRESFAEAARFVNSIIASASSRYIIVEQISPERSPQPDLPPPEGQSPDIGLTSMIVMRARRSTSLQTRRTSLSGARLS